MPNHFLRHLMPVLAAATIGAFAARSHADELLVFISAFASGDQGAIHAYRLDLATGQLKLAYRTTGVENPFFLALSHDRKFLYSIHAPGEFGGKSDEQVAAYQLVGDTGELKLLNRQSTRGSASCYLEVSRGGAVVLANYGTGSVASLPVRADGSLDAIVSFVQHEGSSVNPERQEGPHAHCAVIGPDGASVLAADLGLDRVIIYHLQGAKLTPGRQPFVRTPPGAGPRHLTFHPHGNHCYVINELANSVTVFDSMGAADEPLMLVERQTTSTLPTDFSGTSYCADVKVTPNGRFLYGTNRGHDSIAAYRIGDDGLLTLVGIEPSLGEGPQNLAITPDGQLLLCANMPGNNVVVFRIDAETGSLTPVGAPVSMPGPSCIMIR